MINIEDQNQLFKLISGYITKDIICYAFGGNAMMYYGYKNITKDIDLLFETKEAVQEFIAAIIKLGYKKMSMISVYPRELTEEKEKPAMYTRGDERFDIFLKKIFQTEPTERIKKNFYARYDYIMDKNTLTVIVLSKENIIFLKSITRREKDFDDIKTIVEKEGSIDWEIIVGEAIEQAKKGDKWAILDVEETLQRLKNITFIKQKYFDMLYKAEKNQINSSQIK